MDMGWTTQGPEFESQWGKELYILYIVQAIASVVSWSEFLATDPEVWLRFPALPDFLRSFFFTLLLAIRIT
jgi:hypothetical protein